MSARERLEARRRIERLLDEDRRRVAPPPEKAMTPVGWLDTERRCCSLEGAATTSSFGSVDDERRRTAGRRKPDNESGKNLRNHSSRGPAGTILGAHSNCPPILHLTSSRRSKQREKGGNRSGAECAQAALHSGARDGQRGEPVGRGGAPTARRPATQGGETARRSRTRRGVAARRRRQQAARSGRHPSAYSGGRGRRS